MKKIEHVKRKSNCLNNMSKIKRQKSSEMINNRDDDDDCIYVGSITETIVIEDDTPTEPKLLCDAFSKQRSSTPKPYDSIEYVKDAKYFSPMQTNNKIQYNNRDDDDDCIYVGSITETIVIEDDTPTEPKLLCDAFSKQITSTPKPYDSIEYVKDAKYFSPMQTNNKIQYNNRDDDDDCIYVGSITETIVIEDDTPTEPKLLCDAFSKQITSTPKPYDSIEYVKDAKYFSPMQTNNKIQYNTELNVIGGTFESPSDNNVNKCANADDIIVLDETIASNTSTSTLAESDLVVCIDDIKDSGFIPLTPNKTSNRVNKSALKYKSPNRSNQINSNSYDLFTASEKKRLKEYNSNAFNPHTETETKRQDTKKRMVIIDGSNVAFSHSLNKCFSVRGIQIVIEYFEKIGHDVKVVVPQFRLCKRKSTEPEELERLHSKGNIVFTPCKNLPGKSITSYDDRLILQLACELDAVIISNDSYRDLIHENIAFKKIIENRVVGYSWCNDVFILPKDPYGKWGPSLSSILNRT